MDIPKDINLIKARLDYPKEFKFVDMLMNDDVSKIQKLLHIEIDKTQKKIDGFINQNKPIDTIHCAEVGRLSGLETALHIIDYVTTKR